MAVVAILNMVFGDHSTVTPTMWLYLVIGSVLVGFNEEVIARGQLLVALRSKFGETGVWFISTLLFSLLHLAECVLRYRRASDPSGSHPVRPGICVLPGTSLQRFTGAGDDLAQTMGLLNLLFQRALRRAGRAVHRSSRSDRGRGHSLPGQAQGVSRVGSLPAERSTVPA